MPKPLSARMRKSTRTKAKKTIRKMASPMARRLAHMSRELLAIQKRMNVLAEEFESEYRELQALEKALKAGEAKMSLQAAVKSGLEVREALEERHPNCRHYDKESGICWNRESTSYAMACTVRDTCILGEEVPG